MIAHLDCFAGAAGDMILGALVDAGADLEAVLAQLRRLDIGPFEVQVSEVHRCGLRAKRVEVAAPGGSVARDYATVRRLLDGAGLDPAVAARAGAVFRRLAEAEAKVHGREPEEVVFHELDAVDTVVDVVGTAAALASLGVERVTASPVATGHGTVEAAHARLPVPAPAVVELLRGVPMYGVDLEAELVTPTGAAILAEVVDGFGPMPAMTVAAVGHGAGARELPMPNVVRCILGEPASATAPAVDDVLLEATIDDMSPELYEYVVERLFAAGAADVWVSQAIGKRGRPAQVLHALASPAREGAVLDVLFAETSTIGVRAIPVRRFMLEREWIDVQVGGRPVRVKVARRAGAVVNVAPEYADCAAVARETGRPLKEVFRDASAEAARRLGLNASRGRERS